MVGLMSRSASKAILFVSLMIMASASPIIGSASASNPIILSLDNPHVEIQGGDSDNMTLTITNDGDYTTSYNISLETSGLLSLIHI